MLIGYALMGVLMIAVGVGLVVMGVQRRRPPWWFVAVFLTVLAAQLAYTVVVLVRYGFGNNA